ncbi:MAG: phosphoenolpyruvate--protein phosphotransferase, partial [Spirochaetota bacterium]
NSKLMKEEKFSVYDSDKTGIIVAETIPPTETARINRDRILGFVTEMGGATSHSSIIAKGLNIPTIIDIENLLKEVNEGDKLILDAIHGELIINPTEQTLNFYEDIRDHYQKLTESYLAKVNQDTITLDKLRIYVQSNCESADELELIKKTGAEAIGLYRSEFLFIHRDNLPDEQEQFEVYNHVCESLFPKKVTIRTFDLGGDKFVEGVTRYEHNPYLGWRSVRIAIDRKDMFITQLKALLKASRKRNLRIMFPMISGIEELFKCLEILEEAKEILRKEDIEFDENIKVGTMIEVPSAVLIADELAKYVDFFSIGTNDLIQYTLAADRGNKQIAHLYDAYHPAIFRLIKNTVDIAVKHNIEISVCGEVASDPYYVPILVALGIRTLSLSPSSIPEIKEVLSSIKVSDWKELWDNKLSSIYNKNEIKKIIRDKMYKDCPEICELEKF